MHVVSTASNGKSENKDPDLIEVLSQYYFHQEVQAKKVNKVSLAKEVIIVEKVGKVANAAKAAKTAKTAKTAKAN